MYFILDGEFSLYLFKVKNSCYVWKNITREMCIYWIHQSPYQFLDFKLWFVFKYACYLTHKGYFVVLKLVLIIGISSFWILRNIYIYFTLPNLCLIYLYTRNLLKLEFKTDFWVQNTFLNLFLVKSGINVCIKC